MAKPEIFPVRKLLRMDTETAAAIEAFRRSQKPKPNASEAMRRLMQDRLIELGYLRPEPGAEPAGESTGRNRK